MNEKFVVFLESEGLQACIASAAKNSGAIVFEPFHSKIIKKLFSIHNAWRLNRIKELPFKKIWFSKCLNEDLLNQTDSIFFLFYESFYLTYSKKYLKYLKGKYKNGKFIYIFLNPIDKMKLLKYNSVKKYFDAGVAIYREDAEKYGLLLNEYYCYAPPEIEDNSEYKSDIFFVGVNKGRLSRLLSIYELMKKEGIRCDFHVTDVAEADIKYESEIVYNKRMSYEEYLQRLKNTKCLLEILQDDASYFSIRTIEAMQYHKKLLTTNAEIRKYEFYDEKIIQVFKTADDIEPAFIIRDEPDELVDLFPDEKLWSFDSFKEYLIRQSG